MKTTVSHPVYGEIAYEEGLWSGKKTVSFNGQALRKMDKNTFAVQLGADMATATLRGSMLTGVSLTIQRETIWIIPKPLWYEWALAVLPLVLNLIWGNSTALCSIIPVVGGAIGGAFNGAGMIVIMTLIRGKSFAHKLLIGLLGMIVAFAISAALGYLMLAAFAG